MRFPNLRAALPPFLALLPLLASLPVCALAQPQSLALRPDTAEVGLRMYGMGLIPLDGKFTRFQGAFTYDPADKAHCQVDLRVEAGSLVMNSQSVRDEVVGPEFMDTARFPLVRYTGRCEPQGANLSGDLAMHGVTNTFALTLDWHPDSVRAEGHLRRADWGITARPLVGGSTIRISVSTSLRQLSTQHAEAR